MNNQNTDKETFNVIVAGGRDFSDYGLLCQKLDRILAKRKGLCPINIISGGANGADRLGERYAREHGFQLTVKPANWDEYGKRAGYVRNGEMADIADALVAFWDGESHGTKHMIGIASERNLLVRVIRY